MALLVCCEVLPTTVMTLPAAQGGLTASFQLYARHMRDWGVSVPSMGPALAALAITALLAASARLLEHAVSQEEYVSHCMLTLLTYGGSKLYLLYLHVTDVPLLWAALRLCYTSSHLHDSQAYADMCCKQVQDGMPACVKSSALGCSHAVSHLKSASGLIPLGC